MSTDAGRKDFADKAADKMTPDTSKSTVDQAKDTITGTADKVARDAVPDSQKSTSQEVHDKTSRTKDHVEGTTHTDTTTQPTVVDKAKHAVGMDKH